MVAVIVQDHPDLLDRSVDGMIELDKLGLSPKRLLNFRPRHQFARTSGEKDKQSGGLILEPPAPSVLAEFAGSGIQLERIEAEMSGLFILIHSVSRMKEAEEVNSL